MSNNGVIMRAVTTPWNRYCGGGSNKDIKKRLLLRSFRANSEARFTNIQDVTLGTRFLRHAFTTETFRFRVNPFLIVFVGSTRLKVGRYHISTTD